MYLALETCTALLRYSGKKSKGYRTLGCRIGTEYIRLLEGKGQSRANCQFSLLTLLNCDCSFIVEREAVSSRNMYLFIVGVIQKIKISLIKQLTHIVKGARHLNLSEID